MTTPFFIDIETIGTSDPEVIAELNNAIKAPGQYKKPESIEQWLVENRDLELDKAIRNTSFDGGLGHVICFGSALDGATPSSVILQPLAGVEHEAEMLRLIAGRDVDREAFVIGHNVGWDARFLWQRFVCLGIKPPIWLRRTIKARPWEIGDTMMMWNPDREKKISLDKLCKRLGVPSSKGEMDGSMVWDYYKAGRMDEIATYCRADVEATRTCYLRMTA